MEKISILLIGFTVVCMLFAGCGENTGPKEDESNYATKFDKKNMDEAITKAKKTLPEFIKALKKPSPGMKRFAIKRGFKAGKKADAEHMWIFGITYDGKIFKGRIGNQPMDTKEVKYGDIVEVKPEQITDWKYVDGGILKGGYTIRVLVKDFSPKEREKLFKKAGYRFE